MDTLVNTMRGQLRSERTSAGMLTALIHLLFRRASAAEWWIRVITFILPTLFLTVVILQPWVDPKWMFLDSLTAAELSGDCCHSHFGFVSTTGIILWVATAASGLFAAAVLIMTRAKLEKILFPLLGGLLTGWIALDDAFLLHETVLPAFGVPQNLVIAAYVALASAYAGVNFRQILANDFWLLAMGAAALAASIAVDVLFHSLNPVLVLIEDSAKFFGIFCWASFHITSFAKLLTKEMGAGLHD